MSASCSPAHSHGVGITKACQGADRETNERALKDGSRLFSVYEMEGENKSKTRFYVITEWNREATTILLPEDY